MSEWLRATDLRDVMQVRYSAIWNDQMIKGDMNTHDRAGNSFAQHSLPGTIDART
jgi:hypothetical protein